MDYTEIFRPPPGSKVKFGAPPKHVLEDIVDSIGGQQGYHEFDHCVERLIEIVEFALKEAKFDTSGLHYLTAPEALRAANSTKSRDALASYIKLWDVLLLENRFQSKTPRELSRFYFIASAALHAGMVIGANNPEAVKGISKLGGVAKADNFAARDKEIARFFEELKPTISSRADLNRILKSVMAMAAEKSVLDKNTYWKTNSVQIKLNTMINAYLINCGLKRPRKMRSSPNNRSASAP
jgi:hypothetical protein